MAEPFAPAPPGTALSDCARRNPSEILSRTQSVSAFLPGKVSKGSPFLRRIALRALPPLRRKSAYLKNKKRTGRLQARPLNASPYSVPYCFTAQCDGDGYFVRNECNSPLARRAPWPLSHCPSTLACFSLQRVHRSILDCACSASGRISRLPSPTGRRWREILNRGQNARKASVSGIGGKTRRVPQAARTSDVVRATTLRSC